MSKKEDRTLGVGTPKKAVSDHSKLFIIAFIKLLALALHSENRASKPAGKLLGYIHAVIARDHKKLCEANETYKAESQRWGKLLRADVWFPKSPLYQAISRELWHCWFYRGELFGPLVQPKWGPEEYRPFLKLPRLSLKSFPRWEKELWKLIRKHNPELLAKLRANADRKQRVRVHLDGVTKYVLKPLNLTFKHLRSQFRRHLKSIATACG